MTTMAPFWWDDVPRPTLAETPLPATVDVAIVGSGYTGLNAALETARGGRSGPRPWRRRFQSRRSLLRW